VKLINLAALTSTAGGSAGAEGSSPLHCSIELDNDEAALCVTVATFVERSGQQQYVIVGTATALSLSPRRAISTALRTYRVCLVDDGGEAAMDEGGSAAPAAASPGSRWTLQLEHVTPIDDALIPGALIPFAGRVLVGAGNKLCLFDLGQKKLLRKCELPGLPSFVTCLASSLDRVFVGDAAESIIVVRYRRAENAFVIFADEPISRWCTAITLLDHDTIAVGDRFGTIAVLRIPEGANDDAGEVPVTGRSGDKLALNGAPFKLTTLAQFYCGGAVTSLSRGALSEGGLDVVLYSTAAGALGVLAPLLSKDAVDFFMHLEMYLRATESISVIGRDHLMWRSYFAPVMVRDSGGCASHFCPSIYLTRRPPPILFPERH
jgi:splicing factor 3B subunit 3